MILQSAPSFQIHVRTATFQNSPNEDRRHILRARSSPRSEEVWITLRAVFRYCSSDSEAQFSGFADRVISRFTISLGSLLSKRIE